MKFTLQDDGYVKLEIKGKLRQASFCSVGSAGSADSYGTYDYEERYCDVARSRKEAQSFSSDFSSSDQLIRRRQKRTFKSLGKSLSKRTRSFGSIVFGFFRLRGLFGRLRKMKHHRHMEEEEVLLS